MEPKKKSLFQKLKKIKGWRGLLEGTEGNPFILESICYHLDDAMHDPEIEGFYADKDDIEDKDCYNFDPKIFKPWPEGDHGGLIGFSLTYKEYTPSWSPKPLKFHDYNFEDTKQKLMGLSWSLGRYTRDIPEIRAQQSDPGEEHWSLDVYMEQDKENPNKYWVRFYSDDSTY